MILNQPAPGEASNRQDFAHARKLQIQRQRWSKIDWSDVDLQTHRNISRLQIQMALKNIQVTLLLTFQNERDNEGSGNVSDLAKIR